MPSPSPSLQSPPVTSSPLTFLSDVSTANMTNVVLIEKGFPQFQSFVNDKSFAIVYEPDSTLSDLVALLRQKFTSIQRIAVVSHYSAEPNFLEYGRLFSPSDLVPGVATYSKNTQGLVDILKEFKVANIDFLACKTLTDLNWTAFFGVLQAQTGVVVGASLDDTGNLKYGGNWVMENTNENVKAVYFNASIDNYASLLATFSQTYSFGVLNFSYTVGQTTAIIVSVGTLTGAVTIPATVTYNSVTLSITEMWSNFVNQNGITSIVILAPIADTTIDLCTGCQNLTSVTFPNTVSSFGRNCLKNCPSLTYFNFPPLVTSIPQAFFGFAYNNVYTTDLIIPDRMTSIGGNAFTYNNGIKKIYVPPGCYIEDGAFAEMRGMTEATIYGNGWIGYQTFTNCISLKKVTFGPGVTRISNLAFLLCSALPSVTRPSTLEYLDLDSFFEHCWSLKYLQIPASVTTFGMTTMWNTGHGGMNNIVFDFMHENSFPTTHVNMTIALNSSTTMQVSKKVQAMPNYLAMVAMHPAATFVGMATVNYSVYTPTIPVSAGPTVELTSISTADLTDTTIIGTTPTEQKQFTSSTVKTLFSANSAQKQMILPAGVVLPGFTIPADTPVFLFNASSTVANNKVASLSKDMLSNKTFYILLEAGDSLTMHSNTDSVVISKSGSTFTLTNSAGSTTKSSGQSYTYDGLSILLGSIFGTLKPTSVNFVLPALNSVISLSNSLLIPNYNPSITSDATITLSNGITVAQAQSTFFFRTDDPITLDASFVYYYVNTDQWANKPVVLSPKNGIVTTNAYVTSDPVGKDFLRDLARQLFGTYLGADLFTNEDSVITDINSKCDTVATNLISLLSSIDKTAGTLSGLQTDSSGNKYFNDNTTTSNISRELFNQLMTNAVTRFSDIVTNYKMNATEDGIYKMPILAGDTITFKMTISPAGGQVVAVPTGPTSLINRTYTVILNVIA